METEQGIVFKKSDGDYDSVPVGIHNCKVVDVEIGETKFGESTKFVLLTNQKDRDGALMDIWAYASGSSPTPRNKLGRWIMAIMGVKNFKEIPESLTANQLMDQLVRCQVVEYTNPEGIIRTKVEDILLFEGEAKEGGDGGGFDMSASAENPAPGASGTASSTLDDDDDIPF